MSEQEEFLARWMRLKLEKDSEAQPNAAGRQRAEVAQSLPPVPIGPEPVPVAVASLPSVESITSESDIRLFLQSGVPAQLVQAALRAAWATDPAIRDFVGIADSQWDFNDPSAMPGFGPLPASPGAQSPVRPSVPPLDGQLDTGSPSSESINPERDGQVDGVWLSSGKKNGIPESVEVSGQATYPREDNTNSRPRRHGSALPK